MDLKDKVILLTGAGSGIGRALARQLTAAGASLLLGGRNPVALESLRGELPLPGDHRIVVADIASAAGRAAIVAACANYPRPLDAVINNAGINQFALFTDLGDNAIAGMLEANLVANPAHPCTVTHATRAPHGVGGQCRLRLRQHRLSWFRHLQRRQVRPARVQRSTAPRTRRVAGEGALRCAAGHPHRTQCRRRRRP